MNDAEKRSSLQDGSPDRPRLLGILLVSNGPGDPQKNHRAYLGDVPARFRNLIVVCRMIHSPSRGNI